jgi:hypothetical protein
VGEWELPELEAAVSEVRDPVWRQRDSRSRQSRVLLPVSQATTTEQGGWIHTGEVQPVSVPGAVKVECDS